MLNPTESGIEVVDVNAVRGDHCRFGSRQEDLADPKGGRYENKGDEDGEDGGQQTILRYVGKEMRDLVFVLDGKKCNMKFLDAEVKSPLAPRRGKHRRVPTAGIVHRKQEHWAEDSNGQEEKRVGGAIGRTSGFETDEKVRFDEPNTNDVTLVFMRPA